VIFVSIYIPFSKLKSPSYLHLLTMLAFACIAYFLTGLTSDIVAQKHWYFVGGALAATAMILPGISGAYLLKALALYEPVLRSLNEATQLQPIAIFHVALFIAGVLLGLGLFARALHYVLHHHYKLTLSALIGLMAGGLRVVWPFGVREYDIDMLLHDFQMPIAWMIAGFISGALLIVVESKSEENKHEQI